MPRSVSATPSGTSSPGSASSAERLRPTYEPHSTTPTLHRSRSGSSIALSSAAGPELASVFGRRRLTRVDGRTDFEMIPAVRTSGVGVVDCTRYEVLDDPTCWSRSPIGSPPRRGRRTWRRARPPEPMRLCSSCWPRRSGPRSSGSCPDRSGRDPGEPISSDVEGTVVTRSHS